MERILFLVIGWVVPAPRDAGTAWVGTTGFKRGPVGCRLGRTQVERSLVGYHSDSTQHKISPFSDIWVLGTQLGYKALLLSSNFMSFPCPWPPSRHQVCALIPPTEVCLVYSLFQHQPDGLRRPRWRAKAGSTENRRAAAIVLLELPNNVYLLY